MNPSEVNHMFCPLDCTYLNIAAAALRSFFAAVSEKEKTRFFMARSTKIASKIAQKLCLSITEFSSLI